MEYEMMPMPSSAAICSIIAVLPIPGGPIRRTGLCFSTGMAYAPNSSFVRYALTAFLICVLALLIFIVCSCAQ